VLTVLVTKAAANPQTMPITVPLRTPPVNHTTPRLTSKDTTTKTIVDRMTVPVILAIIFASLPDSPGAPFKHLSSSFSGRL
jgi:hypothetical protein